RSEARLVDRGCGLRLGTLLRIAHARHRLRVGRGPWNAAVGRNLAFDNAGVTLVIALRLRAHELHQCLRYVVLAFRVALGRLSGAGLQTVDDGRDPIEVTLDRLYPWVGSRGVGTPRASDRAVAHIALRTGGRRGADLSDSGAPLRLDTLQTSGD